MSRVSIIVPVFNELASLHSNLSSLDRQTYKMSEIEVVVVDNASSPAISLDETYQFKLRLIRCMTPGSYAARNAGSKEAAGQVLVFTDADCWADPDWLARGISSLMAEADKSVIGGEVSLVKPEEPTAVAVYQWAVGFGQESNIYLKGFSATANLFCTRAQFDIVGPFDERLLSGGDREWCWRAAKCGIKVVYEPKAVVYTAPRTSLSQAVRQARRVVAGRKALRTLGLAHVGIDAVQSQRSTWQALVWILSNPKLRWRDRLRVLYAAAVIRAAVGAEHFRLALGAHAERR